MIRSVEEGFAYLESFTNFERLPGGTRKWRLERMQELCDRTGSPQDRFASIHIAGSKGKGSTATFLAALLEASGTATGLYTSPHIEDYRERITRAGTPLRDHEYLRELKRLETLIGELKNLGREGDELPTTFELLTLLAFRLFEQFPWAVLETGLGGRLDATNVVRPRATVITPIELEHTEYLGDTIPEIAGEKAGIIKPGIPLFTAPLHPEAAAAIGDRAVKAGARQYRYEEIIREKDVSVSEKGTTVRAELFGEEVSFHLQLLGARQARNALLAYAVARTVRPSLTETEAQEALKAVRLPGRMELFPGTPPLLLDGAHTPDSIAFLVETVGSIFPPPWTLLFGSVRGKRHEEMARHLIPNIGRAFIVRPGTFRPSDPPSLAVPFRDAGVPTEIIEDSVEALERAYGVESSVIVATGSFYLAGLIRRALRHLDDTAPAQL